MINNQELNQQQEVNDSLHKLFLIELESKLKLPETGFPLRFGFALLSNEDVKKLKEILGLGEFKDIFLIEPQKFAKKFNLEKNYNVFIERFYTFLKKNKVLIITQEVFANFVKEEISQYKKEVISKTHIDDIFRNLSYLLVFSSFILEKIDNSISFREVFTAREEVELYLFGTIHALARSLTEGQGVSYTEDQSENGVVELPSYEYHQSLAYAELITFLTLKLHG